ncbi:MAG TPA: FtsX-like permease family protein, partial [Gemmatimonadaceae bacterium]|nr:FtsX-like permease family protein [Gemmatimonadaceae bacterium]
AGAGLGQPVAAVGTRALLALVPGSLPRADDVAMDARVVLATLGVSLLAGAAFGLLAALRAGAPALVGGLQGLRATAGAARQTARRTLVAAQVALSLVLLVGAGLLAQSFWRLQRVDPGFAPEGAMTAGVLMPIADFDQRRDGPRWARALGAYDARLRATPGVAAAGGASGLPLSGATETGSFVIEGAPASAPGQGPSADYVVMTPGYLDAMRIPLLAGRGFDAHDDADAPLVVLVSQAAARRYWPGRSPIGARLYVFGDQPRTVIGVVGDVRQLALDVPPNPTIYLPEAQYPYPFLSFVVRAACPRPADGCDAGALVPAMRQALAEVDPQLALDEVRPLHDVLRESLARRRFSLVVLGAFAAAALVLSVVGLYGVIAYAVAQRTRELGVRVALGAQRGDVLRLVLGEGVRVTLAGLVVGLAGALALTRVLRAQLYQVSPTSPAVYVVVALLVAAVALAATWIPARRATRVPPTLALRAE